MSFLGYVWRFGGSDRGSQGPKWLIYAPMAWIKWVENRIGVIGIFGWEDGSLPTLRVDKKNCVVLGVYIAVLGV